MICRSSQHMFQIVDVFDINISKGSVVTHLRSGGIFNYYSTANLCWVCQWKNF